MINRSDKSHVRACGLYTKQPTRETTTATDDVGGAKERT